MAYIIPQNSTDLTTILLSIGSQVDLIFMGISVLIFFTIMLAGYNSEKKKNSEGNILVWATFSSVVTTFLFITFTFTLGAGLNLVFYTGFWVIISIILVAIYFNVNTERIF